MHTRLIPLLPLLVFSVNRKLTRFTTRFPKLNRGTRRSYISDSDST